MNHGRHISMECMCAYWGSPNVNFQNKWIYYKSQKSIDGCLKYLFRNFFHVNIHIFVLKYLVQTCDVVYKGRWLTQAGCWFILRFCEHFTCLSSKIQNDIKLENISNLITSPSSYVWQLRSAILLAHEMMNEWTFF
jgi:hypothetical protein